MGHDVVMGAYHYVTIHTGSARILIIMYYYAKLWYFYFPSRIFKIVHQTLTIITTELVRHTENKNQFIINVLLSGDQVNCFCVGICHWFFCQIHEISLHNNNSPDLLTRIHLALVLVIMYCTHIPSHLL